MRLCCSPGPCRDGDGRIRAELHNAVQFRWKQGELPSPLSQGLDGNLYGTTAEGGAHQGGTFFKITPDGTLTTLHNFCSQTNCPDGAGPVCNLTLSTDGKFYGTTTQGGTNHG